MGAEYIVSGSFFELFGSLRIDSRIIKVETGEIVVAEGIDGATSDFMGLHKGLSSALIHALPKDVEKEKASVEKAQDDDVSYDAVLAYSEAIDLIEQGLVDEAKDRLTTVLNNEPNFSRARSLLETL